MKIGKNLIIPFAAIIILALYLIFNSTGKMNYTIPEFTPIKAQAITNIEIKGLTESVKLYSDNGVWKFNPDNLRAEPSTVARMLSFLENPEFIDMVSDTENYQNYGLGEGKYISIKATIKDNTSGNPDRELYIGDLNTSKNFAFIRRSDNKAVFTTRADIRKLFNTSEKDLIDKKILDFDSSKVDKIELNFGGKKTILNKSVDSDSKDIWKTAQGVTIDTKVTGQSLRYLSNSRFDSYIPEEGKSNESIFTITLYEGKTSYIFTITKKNEKNYSGLSSYAGKGFTLSENTGTQIMKMFSDIIKPK